MLQDSKQTCKDLYHCICTIIGVHLTMPPTSATHERSFSGMKRIQNFLRTTMTSDRLSSLALIHEHKDMDIDADPLINVFASEKCITPFLDWRWINVTLTFTLNVFRCWTLISLVFPLVFYLQNTHCYFMKFKKTFIRYTKYSRVTAYCLT